jgi:hypothetical protein
MGDSLFNIIIVLIPIAIFIGRVVVQARNKRNPTSPVRPRPITVHFEDDDEENDDERQFAPSAVSKQVINNKNKAETYIPPPLVDNTPKPPPVKKAEAPSAEPAHGFLYINHLSPMKQAVVLAEILGPPKGME